MAYVAVVGSSAGGGGSAVDIECFPKTLNAVFVAKRVFAERGVPPIADGTSPT